MAPRNVNVNKTSSRSDDFGMGSLDPLRAEDPAMAEAGNAQLFAESRVQSMKDKALMTQQMGGAPENTKEALMGKGDPGAIHSANAGVAATKVNKNNAARKHYEELYKKGEQGVDDAVAQVKEDMKASLKKTADPKFTNDPRITEEMANSIVPNKDMYRDRDGRLQVTKYYHDLVANTESFLASVNQQGIDNMLAEVSQAVYGAADPVAAQGAEQPNPMAPPEPQAPQAAPATPQAQPAQPAEPVVETPKATALIQYKVKPSDGIEDIAAANGTTVDDIMRVNPTIKDPTAIVAGKTLLLPGTQEAIDNDAILSGSGSVSSSSSSSKTTPTQAPATPTDPSASGRNEDVVKQQFALEQILNTDELDRGSIAQYIAAGGDVKKLKEVLSLRDEYSTNDLTDQQGQLSRESTAARDRATAQSRRESQDIKRNLAIEKTGQGLDKTAQEILTHKNDISKNTAALSMLDRGESPSAPKQYAQKKVADAWIRLDSKGINVGNYNMPEYKNDPDVKYIKSAVAYLKPQSDALASQIGARITRLNQLGVSQAQSQEIKDALANKRIAKAVELSVEKPEPTKKKKTAKDFM